MLANYSYEFSGGEALVKTLGLKNYPHKYLASQSQSSA